MNIIDRLLAPTPRFFRVLRNTGFVLTAANSAILAAPVSLPGTLVTIAGYLVVGGSVLSAVSQLAVDEQALLPVASAPTLPVEIPILPNLAKGKGKGKGGEKNQ